MVQIWFKFCIIDMYLQLMTGYDEMADLRRKSGGSGRARTSDPVIMSHLL